VSPRSALPIQLTDWFSVSDGVKASADVQLRPPIEAHSGIETSWEPVRRVGVLARSLRAVLLVWAGLFAASCVGTSHDTPPSAKTPQDSLRPDLVWELERRAFWKQQIGMIQASWGRKDLDHFFSRIRKEIADPTYGTWLGKMKFENSTLLFSSFPLDDSFHCFVTWKGKGMTAAEGTVEIVGFSDLRNRIVPDLYAAVAAIHRSPDSLLEDKFNGLRLLQAVNALRQLGKEGAGRAFEAYLALEKQLSATDVLKYRVDSVRLLPILELLVENPAGPPSIFATRQGSAEKLGEIRRSWPLFPLSVTGDFPFTLAEQGSMAYPGDERLLDYYDDRRTRLRALPLSPTINPVEAADELTNSQAWRALGLSPEEETWKRGAVRRQALRMLAPLLRLPPEDWPGGIVGPSEQRWREISGEAARREIRWDPQGQRFVVSH